MTPSRTQIDRLGERLRTAEPTDDDLRMLDEFRRSFGGAYDLVVKGLRELGLDPTGRPAKSTKSIVDKLRRESVRLSQIQDIAGCRVLVPDLAEQDRAVAAAIKTMKDVVVVDRRTKPSHNYRAVHVVVRHLGVPVEIQYRTHLQHLWAEVSEKLSDVIDLAIKYGGGDPQVQRTLATSSTTIAKLEELKLTISRLPDDLAKRADVARATATLSEVELGLEQALQALISAAKEAE